MFGFVEILFMLYEVVGVFKVLEVKLSCLKIFVSSIHDIMILCQMQDSLR